MHGVFFCQSSLLSLFNIVSTVAAILKVSGAEAAKWYLQIDSLSISLLQWWGSEGH